MTTVISNLDAPLGAEVSGVDLSKPLAQSDIDAIEAAWRTRLVVVIHQQALSDPQLLPIYFYSSNPESSQFSQCALPEKRL